MVGDSIEKVIPIMEEIKAKVRVIVDTSCTQVVDSNWGKRS